MRNPGKGFAAGLVVASGLVMVGAAGAQSAERLGCPAGYHLMSVARINATLTTPGFDQAVIDFEADANDGLSGSPAP